MSSMAPALAQVDLTAALLREGVSMLVPSRSASPCGIHGPTYQRDPAESRLCPFRSGPQPLPGSPRFTELDEQIEDSSHETIIATCTASPSATDRYVHEPNHPPQGVLSRIPNCNVGESGTHLTD
jgi:hypothetical protein